MGIATTVGIPIPGGSSHACEVSRYRGLHFERGGIKVGYEVFGTGEPAIVLLTSWAIVHARQWKAQVPYLARRFRVITVEAGATAGRPAAILRVWQPVACIMSAR